jgi:hypothetical protein
MNHPMQSFLLGALLAATAAMANAATGYAIRGSDEQDVCTTEKLDPYVDETQLKTKAGLRYQASPADYEFFWSRSDGGLFAKATLAPHTRMKEIKFIGYDKMNTQIRNYKLTLDSGEVFQIDDNGASHLHLCPHGTERADYDICVPVHYLTASCLDSREGTVQQRYLSFYFHSSGIPPKNAKYLKFAEIQAIPDEQMTGLLADYTAALESRPARLAQREAARKAEQERIRKEQGEQMRVAMARRQDILKNSSVNSFMFCESSSYFLLGPGEPITSLMYQCDALSGVIGVRDLLATGWEIVSQTRTPAPVIGGGVGYTVSLQLKKTRK